MKTNRICRSMCKVKIGHADPTVNESAQTRQVMTLEHQALPTSTSVASHSIKHHNSSIFAASSQRMAILTERWRPKCKKANKSATSWLHFLVNLPPKWRLAKAHLINAMFLPILTYQCQTCILTKAQERKISYEMRCLRCAANQTRRKMIKNKNNPRDCRDVQEQRVGH